MTPPAVALVTCPPPPRTVACLDYGGSHDEFTRGSYPYGLAVIDVHALSLSLFRVSAISYRTAFASYSLKSELNVR